MNQSILVVAAMLLASCGGRELSKSAPANSGANSGPGLNSSTTVNNSSGRMEQGSADAEVISAYNRILPLFCAYDATCAEPLLGGACPAQPVPNGEVSGQCWVVNGGQLSECENALRGAQCQGQWENFPMVCYTAVRQCECADGYIAGWTDEGEQGCFAPCDNGECSGTLGCYDGACTPLQESRCQDNEIDTFVDGEFGCYAACFNGQSCDDGFECNGEACVPNSGEGL